MIIVKSELEGLKTSIFNKLSVETGDSNALSTAIEQFKSTLNNKNNFEGGYVDKILKNLESFSNATRERKDLSIELSTKIDSSLNTIINAMGAEPTIDTSKKEELIKNYEDCQKLISSLESQASAYIAKYDKTGITAFRDQAGGINREISSCKARLNAIEIDIQKIERVEQADGEALSNLSGLNDMLSAYKTLTTQIEELKSNIPTYEPPAVALANKD